MATNLQLEIAQKVAAQKKINAANRLTNQRNDAGQTVNTSGFWLGGRNYSDTINNMNALGGGSSGSGSSGSGSKTSSSSVASTTSAYDDYLNSLRRQRQAQLDQTINRNNSAADQSLRDAYVSYMLGNKNINQQLRAAGINGGATETSLMDANNTYQNNRNKIIAARDERNANARNRFDSGVMSDYSNYLAKYRTPASATYSSKSSSSGSSGSATSKAASTTRQKNLAQNMIAYWRNLGYSNEQIQMLAMQNGLVSY